MTNSTRPIVLSIAGTDPTGGAGIQADIKAISALGCYAASVVTALVAQNTCSVQAIHTVPPDFIAAQIDAVFSDLNVSSIKIGMIHDETVMTVIASALKQYPTQPVVLDPVMIAKNGSPLLRPESIENLKNILFQHATLITPNLPEAETLLNTSIQTPEAMAAAAMNLGDQFGCHVLIKGGHLKGAMANDVLFDPELGLLFWFKEKRIMTRNTHGTGCTLSSAIATFLAKGLPVKESIQQAKNYLTHAISSGQHQKIGQGSGPVDHFYFLQNLRTAPSVSEQLVSLEEVE